MKKLFLFTMILLIFVACDRFEHNLEPTVDNENFIIAFFNTFADSIETILPKEDVTNIMEFFHDNYSNNGLIKSDVENFYKAFSYVNMPLTFEAVIIDTNAFAIDWRLLVTSPDSETTFMDTIISDVLIETDNSYMFYGNQANMRNVVVEMFTAMSCVNCPIVEEALHNLKEEYGSRFSYVEYHINDILDPGNTPLLIYYENHGYLPYTVINGNAEIITGSSVTIQQDIEDVIVPLMEQPLTAKFLDAQADINGTTLNGSVQIELDGSISTNNLKLVAVLMEELSTEHQNHSGENLHNIELKRETVDISSLNRQELVTFTISGLDQLASGYQQLPDDLILVLWIQTLEDHYNGDTCTIYNVIEINIIR